MCFSQFCFLCTRIISLKSDEYAGFQKDLPTIKNTFLD